MNLDITTRSNTAPDPTQTNAKRVSFPVSVLLRSRAMPPQLGSVQMVDVAHDLRIDEPVDLEAKDVLQGPPLRHGSLLQLYVEPNASTLRANDMGRGGRWRRKRKPAICCAHGVGTPGSDSQ